MANYYLLLLMISSLFISSIALSSTSAILPPVIDINGNKVKLGDPYYVLSGTFLHPVGLCLNDDDNNNNNNYINVKTPYNDEVIMCPGVINKGGDHDRRGLPVIFSSVDEYPEDMFVREQTLYNIEFLVSDDYEIHDEAVWKFKRGLFPNQMFVAIGSRTHKTRFSIKKVALGYKIVYCVDLPLPRIPICYPLGFTMDESDEVLHLGIGEAAHPVMFFFKNTARCNPSSGGNCS